MAIEHLQEALLIQECEQEVEAAFLELGDTERWEICGEPRRIVFASKIPAGWEPVHFIPTGHRDMMIVFCDTMSNYEFSWITPSSVRRKLLEHRLM